MEAKRFYQILNVDEESDVSQIRQSFRRIAMDQCLNPPARTITDFAAIEEAYAILSDSKLRRIYDLEGKQSAIDALDREDMESCGEGVIQFRIRNFHDLMMGAYNCYFGPKSSFKAKHSGWHGRLGQLIEHPPVYVPLQFSVPKWITELYFYRKISTEFATGEVTDTNVISAPTGSGKTIGTIAAILMANVGKSVKILVIVPTRLVATKLYQTLVSAFPNFGSLFGLAVRRESSYTIGSTCVLIGTPGIGIIALQQDKAIFTHVLVDELHVDTLQLGYLLAMINGRVGRNIFKICSPRKFQLFLASASANVCDKAASYFAVSHRISIASDSRRYVIRTIALPDLIHFIGDEMKENLTHEVLTDAVFKSKFNALESECDLQHTSVNETTNKAYLLVFRILQDTPDGNILVFVPGTAMMTTIRNRIEQRYRDVVTKLPVVIHQLHSQESRDQDFNVSFGAKDTTRRLFLATNIAETSLTLPNVVYVIDSLLENSGYSDVKNGVRGTDLTYIAKESIEQRMGRTGRSCDGFYFPLCSMTELKELQNTSRISRAKSEDPTETMFQLARIGESPLEVADFLNSPKDEEARNAVLVMRSIHVLKSEALVSPKITSSGRIVAELRMFDPELSLLLVYGTVLNCQKSISELAACLSTDTPIIIHDRNPQVSTFFNDNVQNKLSEHEVIISAYEQASKEFTQLNYLPNYTAADKAARRARSAEFGKKFNAKMVEQAMNNYEQIRLYLERAGLDMQQDCEPNDKSFIAHQICIVSAFGYRTGKHVEDGFFSHFFHQGTEFKFYGETVWLNQRGGDRVPIYYRMTKYVDRSRAPISLVKPFFFACFGLPLSESTYKDGKMVFTGDGTLSLFSIVMPNYLYTIARNAREVLAWLLEYARYRSTGYQELIKEILAFAELVYDFDIPADNQ